jgi:hypothetical protein
MRRALIDQQTVSLLDVEGHEIVVTVDQGQIILGSPSMGRKVQICDLMFLSPNSEERIQTLKRLIDRFGPTAPDFSALLTKAEERELSEDEVDALFAEGATGVAALQTSTIAALKTNQATLENLVPNSLVYIERFCAPNIAGADHEEYFRRVLPQYRKDLIHRGLVRGLDICLRGRCGMTSCQVPGRITSTMTNYGMLSQPATPGATRSHCWAASISRWAGSMMIAIVRLPERP